MNKKGFTTIELITSFTLASIIMIILFNIILIMKDNLSRVNAMTNTLVEKDNLSYNINKRLKEKELTSLTTCSDGDKCFLFTYGDSTSDKLVYSITDKTITFNNYTFNITDDMNVEVPTITEHYDTMSSTTFNGYFILNIPITVGNKDYSIKVNRHFNTDSVVVDLTVYQYDNNGNKYTPVEYLQSTGTQYIDTNVNSTSNIILEASIKGDYTNSAWYGGRNSKYIGIYNYNGRFDYVGLDSQYINPSPDAWHEIHHGTNLIIDNTLVRTYNKMDYQIDFSITLFAGNNHGNIMSHSSIKMRKASIKNGDTLVRDFVPVIDSSNRPCLFDKVEKKCYYNQGTGEFLYG